MKYKLLTVVIGLLLLANWSFAQKGITNNGARIVVSNGGIIAITGGTVADYTNKSAGSTHGRIDLDGKIKLQGDWTNNATSGNVLVNVDTDGEVVFNGTTAQAIGGTATTNFEKLTVNNTNGVSLNSDVNVNSTLGLTAGRITLGSKNMTLGAGSTVSGSPSASTMVVASGTGELRKTFTSTGSFTYPVGDNSGTAEYSPITLNFTSGTFGASAYAGVKVIDAKHPSNTTTGAYITRYWSVSKNNISSFNCNVNGTYLTADVVGTEASMYSGYWNSPNWVKMNPVVTASNQVYGSMSAFYDITAGDQNMFCANSPSIAAVPTDVSCNNGSNGAIALTVSGGLSPYSYTWFTGDGSGLTPGVEDQTGLTAGTYNVTVTDQNGCTDIETIVVTEPLALSTSISPTHTTCFGYSNGVATLSVSGGTVPYTFIWSNSQNTQNISGLTAGNYSVTVTDYKGCVITDATTINQPSAITSSFTVDSVNCYGGSDGTATVSASGGTPGYTYNWSTGATNQTISSLSATNYSISITDNNGCTVTNNISIPQPTQITASIAGTNVNCFGEANGAANLSVSGGSPGYSYLWTGGATTQDISGLTSGTYFVTITDANSCIANKSVVISQPSNLSASITSTPVSCYLGSNGSATVTPSGGTSPYNYTWNTLATTQVINGLSASTYSVTVSDNHTCTIVKSVAVTEPAQLSVSISGNNVSCNGGSDGSATINVGGGTAPYSYAWNSGQTTGNISNLAAADYTLTTTDFNSCQTIQSVSILQPATILTSVSKIDASCFEYANGSIDLSVTGGTSPYEYIWSNTETSEDISGLIAGTYFVTITDSHGCLANTSSTINEGTEIVISTSSSPASCGLSDGSATASASGGTGGFSYLWDDPLGQTNATATGIGLGTYNVIVTDAATCTNQATVSVSEAGAPTLTVISTTNVSCNGGTNGSATVEVSAGTPNYTYNWSSTTVDGPTTNVTSTENGLAAGNHSVTVTDGGGCLATISFQITEPTLLVASVSKINVTCNGGSDGSATAVPSGGTAPYTYLWSNSQTTATTNNLVAGNYNLTITDQLGCTVLKSVTINEPSNIITTITELNVLCNGQSNGGANLAVSGGTPGYTYNWSNGSNTQNISGVAAGTYNVTVTDTKGCVATDVATITEPDLLTYSYTSNDALCYGSSDGSIDISVLGGTTPYNYSWSNGATSEDLLNIVSDSYSVSVVDNNGCSFNLSASVGEPAELVLVLSASNALCNGSADGAINASVTGGTTPYSYAWSVAGTTSQINGLLAGNYSLTVSDNHGCEAISSATVNEPASLAAFASSVPVSCFGGNNGEASVTASGGTTPYTYYWNTTQTSSVISSLSAGNYSVTITDNNNCSTTAATTVTSPAELLLSISGQDVSCFDANDGTATISISGGTPSYSYLWNTGQTSGNLTGLPPANYNLIATDAYGCTANANILISEPPVLVSSFTQVDANCFGQTNGSIDLSLSGGVTPYNYLWSTTATTQDISNIQAGSYSVTITDFNGCQLTDNMIITQPDEIILDIVAADALCFGSTNGTADLSVIGGITPYTYYWSTTGTTEDLSSLPAGTHYVTVTDNHSCVATDSVVIAEPLALEIAINTYDVNCFGAATGAADLSVSGGTPTYVYNWSTGSSSSGISGLIAGSYTVTVTDANSCSSTSIADINQSSEILMSGNVMDAGCFGSSDGAINVSVSGGNTPYSFMWSGGETTQNLAGISANSYTLTVTDAFGCKSNLTSQVNEPAQIVLGFTIQDAHCGAPDGQATVNISSGGISPYSYEWNGLSETSSTIGGMTSGTYTVTVTDNTGCTNSASAVINDLNGPAILIDSYSDATCYNDCNGNASISIAGGTTPYSIAWNSGQTGTSINSLCAGTYSVTVTDNDNCIAMSSVTIGQPDQLAVIADASDIHCNGLCDGIANATVSGGVTPYVYTWSNLETTATIDSLCQGLYNLTISDANDCQTFVAVTINEPALLSGVMTSTSENCYNSGDGSASVNVSGGTTPYNYAWSNMSYASSISELSAGTYYITVSDANSCSFIDSAVISTPDSIYLQTSVIDNLCYGNNQGSIDLTVFGGVTPYQYNWSIGSTTEDISSLASGSYDITIQDNNGCEIYSTVYISEPDPIVITGIVTDELTSNDGAIDLTVTGGVTPYWYLWTNSETTEDLSMISQGIYEVTVTDMNSCTSIKSFSVNNSACTLSSQISSSNTSCNGIADGSVSIELFEATYPVSYVWNTSATDSALSNLASGNYSVTITDANNCVVIDQVDIFEPAVLSAELFAQDLSCFESNNGAAFISPTGGTSPYTVEWSTGDFGYEISNLPQGEYTVTITDANNCILVDTQIINQPALLTMTLLTGNVNCFNNPEGNAEVTVSGGVLPYEIQWSSGQTGTSITGLYAGTYEVTATDANGCGISLIADILQPAELLVNAIVTDEISGNDGSINVNVSGGVSPYDYMWSSGQTSQDISGLSSGIYNVTVTDNNGCNVSRSYSVNSSSCNLVAEVNVIDIACFGDNSGSANALVVSGTQPYTFLWSDQTASTDAEITGLAAGPYQVTIEDANGCVIIETANITQPGLLSSSIVVQNISCFGMSDGYLDLTITSGVPPYSVDWSNGQTIQDIPDLSSGQYNVSITDFNGCFAYNSANVSEPDALSIDALVYDISCFGSETGQIDISVSGGVMPVQYSWSTGDNSEDLNNVPAGDYTLSVTDGNGCYSDQGWTITQSSEIIFFAGITNETAAGNDGAIEMTISGGSTPYIYNWSNGETTEDLTGLIAGIYNLTLTDAYGCENVYVTTVNNEACTLNGYATGYNLNCYSDNTGSAVIVAENGTAPYSYMWSNGFTTDSVSGLPAGIFSVTTTDINGCAIINSVVIDQPDQISVAVNAEGPSCYGLSDGFIELMVTGGVPSYSFNWSNGVTSSSQYDLVSDFYDCTITDANGCVAVPAGSLSQPDQLTVSSSVTNLTCYNDNSGAINLTIAGGIEPYLISWNNGSTAQNLMNIPSGVYDGLITDANGCSVSISKEITQPEELILSSNITPENTGSDGAIDLSVTGGTIPYSYSWISGQSTEDITGLMAGIYSVEVTDFNGCNTGATYAVNFTGCSISASVTTDPVSCFGSFDGAATVSLTGEMLPVTYQWSDGQTTQTAGYLIAGAYSVTVVDNNNCTAIGSGVVDQPTELKLTMDKADILCFGEANGLAGAIIEGGTAPYSLMWSTGGTGMYASNLSEGNYSVTVIDNMGCSATSSVVIEEPPVLNAVISQSDITCFGMDNGAADLTVTGGTIPYSYMWNIAEQSQDLNNLIAGEYIVTVTDNNGCESIATATLVEPAEIDITYVVTNDDGSNNGAIDLTVTGGTSTYDYLWNNAETSENISGLAAAVYTVSVTDGNGCQMSASIPVNDVSCDLNVNLTAGNVICNSQMNGTASAVVSGGTSPYAFSWSSGETDSDISGLGAGTYTVTVSDLNGCLAIGNAHVSEPEPIYLTFSVTEDLGNDDGSAEVMVTGGTSPYSYLWNDMVNQTSPIAVNLVNGTYEVIVTDDNGCSTSGQIDVPLWVSATELANFINTKVFPNPVTDYLNLEIVTNKSEKARFYLVNGLGQRIGISDHNLISGKNEIRFDLSKEAAGVYYIEIMKDAEIHTVRFIKK